MASPPKYRKGREMKKLAARKVSTAMYSHVTHPNARRELARRPPCSSAARPSSLDDTRLRGCAGPEMVEQHRGDVRDPARRPLVPGNPARQHKDLRVLAVQGAVVARLVVAPGDLAERVPGLRREDKVPAPGRAQAAPQPLHGVRVVPVAQLPPRHLEVQRARVSLELPGAPEGIGGARAQAGPQGPAPPQHVCPPLLPPRRPRRRRSYRRTRPPSGATPAGLRGRGGGRRSPP